MTIEISWPAVSGGVVVLSFLGKIAHGLFGSALEKRDEAIEGLGEDLAKKKADHDIDVAALKATQKIVFDKLDTVTREHHDYKLHVAETYVNREVLREQLLPINEALKEIRHDLQEERRK